MKTTRILIFGLLAGALACQAQQPLILQKLNADPAERAAAIAAKQAEQQGQQQLFFNPQNVPATAIAEQITGAIQQLARNLENDPVRIFNYVHDHIRHVLYFGSKKGAKLTLLEKSGNEFDQCALLVSLLRAAGYTNCGYQFGWVELPYTNADHVDLQHWLQLSLSNTNWNTTSNYLDNLIRVYRGYPATAAIWGTNTFGFQRIWVTLTNAGGVYYLDPAFKVHEPITGIDLQTATGFNSNSLMSAAAGTDAGNYVVSLNEAALRGTLAGYTTNLLNYIQSNCPNASVTEVLSGWRIVPSTNTSLSTNLPFTTYTWSGQMPVLNWANQPTNLMSVFKLSFAGTNFTCFMPELKGQRLTLTYDYYNYGQLWLEDTDVAHNYDYVGTVIVSVNHPFGYWNTNSNDFVDTTAFDQSFTNTYDVSGSYVDPPYFNAYNIVYSFEPDWGWLQERQNWLDYVRAAGSNDFSFEVQAETLNIMGLQYVLQTWDTERILAAQAGVLPQNHHFVGRVAQEGGNGYFFDFFLWMTGDISSGAAGSPNSNLVAKVNGLVSYFGSALEHGVIEQLQNSNYVGGSTIKILQLANTNGLPIFLASSTNWQTGFNVLSRLSGYTNDDVYRITASINAGDFVLLPAYGHILLDGYGSWGGCGYVDHVGSGRDGMFINGYYGGQVSDPRATVNPRYVSSAAHAQPRRKPFRIYPTAADPVDMASGAFRVEHTDLSIGQAEPRGITLGSFYDSTRRYENPAGMAPGWVNNYYLNAQVVPSPQASLGRTTPAQAAPMIASTCAALGVYNANQPNPKNWTVTALVAKWAIDNLNKKGVSVIMGKETLQFVQQADGSFTPPANCTWMLTKPSGYVLQERHGDTFKFDSLGRLTNIVDLYNQPLNLTYNSSNWVSTVTDWKSRSFTFNYTGTPSRLTSVTDNAGSRTVKYSYSAAGDLSAFTDAENKTNKFGYDSDHQIVATSNALAQLVTTNIYDGYGFGRVNTQYVQGNTNKTWQIYWSGWETIVRDPAGGTQRFAFDDDNRLVGFQDALGNLSQTFYDGQDHVVATVSPLNETNRFEYDARHNLLRSFDALGYTNQFIYDAQDNLIRTVDARGNTNRFGYNANFQLTGSTNGAGDWVTFAYSGSDGTLTNRTDIGSTNGYGYDNYGQLNRVAFPSGLGNEGFVNNSLGDVLSRTNARGFVTSFQYNNRRELTNTIAPTNVTAKVAFDAVGNVQSSTDARGFTTANTWSATRKLLATTLPGTPQGTPVLTNSYDNRDWLTRTLNPLQQATTNAYDAVGRVASVTDPLWRALRFGYDADGRRIAATNAALEVTRLEWNARNELAQFTTPASTTIKHAYDAVGNQVLLTNRNGKIWQFYYDAANRLTNTVTPRGLETRVTYDVRGLLSTIREPSYQWTTNFYDARGRLTNRVDGIGSTVYRCDANNNVTNVVEQASSLSWTYDAYDRLSTYRDADNNLLQYRYDANGNLTNLVYPDGRAVRYAYDSLNRLTNVTDWASRQTSIEYDLASRVKKITRPNGTVREINYDVAGQTTNIVEKMAIGVPIAFYKLGWNNAARVQWEFGAPLPPSNAPPARAMTFDDDNRIATFKGPTMGTAQNVSHDDDGNLIYGPVTNDTFVSYGYDARNRLTNAASLAYGYDPAGNRMAITNGTNVVRFVVNPNAALSQVLLRVRSGVTNCYIYGLGLLYEVTETATSTNTLTYHYDYRGSTVAFSSDNGIVTADRIAYSAYGTILSRSGTNDTPFLFNGRYGVQTDANGLLYMRARYYNPYLCRFLNPDPLGFGGGLNFYAYADGNPISYLDPFGLGADSIDRFPSWITKAYTARTCIDCHWTPEILMAGILPQDTPWFNAQGTEFRTQQLLIPSLLGAIGGPQLAIASWLQGEFSQGGQGGQAVIGTTTRDPNSIRFSQDSIRPGFQDTRYGTIDDLAAGLRNGSIDPLSIEPIRVVEQGGELYSLDNRRLEAFRQAGVEIPYRVVTPEEAAGEVWKFTTKNAGTSVSIRGR